MRLAQRIRAPRGRPAWYPPATLLFVVVCFAASACSGPSSERSREGSRELAGGTGRSALQPGIEVLLRDSSHLIQGRRLGLITNRSGVSSDGSSSIDLLSADPNSDLVALFAPEHGIRATVGEGVLVADEVDGETGIRIYSLYGETRAPTPSMLREIDVLAFDLQDIGARYYTYVSTMAVSMRAAGEAGIPFLVLDRPNPIGELTQGPMLDPEFATFVGLYPIPVRHGMTAGELARLFVGEFGIDVELHVVPVAGLTRGVWLDQGGLPWVPPSLNMPTIESATHYPGTCLFEGTNLSVGRGTPRAFQVLGAPWIDGGAWAARLTDRNLPGVRFLPVAFAPDAPSDGKFDGVTLSGIRLIVVDRERYDPVATATAALLDGYALAGDEWVWNTRHFDRLAGSARLREAIVRGDELEEIAESWGGGLAEFEELRRPYLIY